MEDLRHKLQSFGIPLNVPATIFCDNKSLVTYVSEPTSMFNKRHNSICYHCVRESQESCKIQVGCITGEINLEDLLTKTTMAGNTKHLILEVIFYKKPIKWKTDKNDDVRIG